MVATCLRAAEAVECLIALVTKSLVEDMASREKSPNESDAFLLDQDVLTATYGGPHGFDCTAMALDWTAGASAKKASSDTSL
tara:strand:- start:364 stop:609 length:246 start_codon:yes stop_codon:yes gene_type:complete